MRIQNIRAKKGRAAVDPQHAPSLRLAGRPVARRPVSDGGSAMDGQLGLDPGIFGPQILPMVSTHFPLLTVG
jgi:hypothetical protein